MRGETIIVSLLTFFVKLLQAFAAENYEYGRAVGKGKGRREKGKLGT
jgi:hypothetical protein